ncbi:MAG: ZIP family metal transporter [Pseudomonadota bacterium]
MLEGLHSISGLYAAIAACLMSFVGIGAMAMRSDWARVNGSYFSAFAVGVLGTGILFHLLPEAIDYSWYALTWAAVGFTVMVLIGLIVQISARQTDNAAALTFGYASIIALSAHSFLDGVLYAAAFHGDAFTGWLSTGGLVLHEFPEGVIALSLLLVAGLRLPRAVFTAAIAAGLTTVAGAVFAHYVVTATGELPLAAMFGGASGGLIYALIFHLGPDAARAPDRRGYFFAGLGVVVSISAIILELVGGGGHDHHHHHHH